jgi:2'-5' RNA ligase
VKLLLEQWKKFILIEELKHQGILKLELNPRVASAAQALQAMLPEEAVRLDEDDLHVTLVHQSVLKPFTKQLKKINFPKPPMVELDEEVLVRESPGKKSWAVKLSNQQEMREYVKNIMEMLGSQNTNPEPERVFHVSLANLTGNPHDSVR